MIINSVTSIDDPKKLYMHIYLEAFEDEWVNSENHWGDWMIAQCTTLALVVLGVNPLFLGGLHLYFMIYVLILKRRQLVLLISKKIRFINASSYLFSD